MVWDLTVKVGQIKAFIIEKIPLGTGVEITKMDGTKIENDESTLAEAGLAAGGRLKAEIV